MKNNLLCAIVVLISTLVGDSAQADNPFVGHWALTLPNGRAGWLGITEKNGKLSAAILWGGGSVKPAPSVEVEGDRLVITRVQVQRRGAAKGKKITETINHSTLIHRGTEIGGSPIRRTARNRADHQRSGQQAPAPTDTPKSPEETIA